VCAAGQCARTMPASTCLNSLDSPMIRTRIGAYHARLVEEVDDEAVRLKTRSSPGGPEGGEAPARGVAGGRRGQGARRAAPLGRVGGGGRGVQGGPEDTATGYAVRQRD